MAKRTTTATPAPAAQLLDAMLKARSQIEAQRDSIFDANSVIHVLSRGFRNDEDDPIRRTCNLIYDQLDTVASTLEQISCDLWGSVERCKGDADATEVSHG